MTVHKIRTWLVAGLLLSTTLTVTSTVTSTVARGQEGVWVDNSAHDLQFFSAVDLDFDNRPSRRGDGFIFRYDKLSWAFTGERNEIGSTDESNASMNPWRNFQSGGFLSIDPNDPDGDPIFIPGTPIAINPPNLPSGIQSAPPRATFAWGERYEFGYFANEAGWNISILDGPAAIHSEIFGFGLTGQDETVTAAPLGLPSPFPGAPNQLLSPLGSVLVVFDDPQNLMLGFIDVVDGVIDGIPGGVLEGDTNGDGVLDGDGNADDIDRDGQYGPDGLDTEDPGEFPDRLGGGLDPDFDDLVVLPTSFQTLTVRNITETQGFEIMRTHRLGNRHRMKKRQNNEVEYAYGARYLRLRDSFLVNGFGGVLGRSFWDTRITNNLVGPQIALKWFHQRDRVQIDWGGRFLFGYNIQNWEQTAALGEDLITGQHNHPLYFPPTYTVHGKQENDFSPLVEMRVQASYQITGAIALRLGYNAIFVDNIRRAAQQVKYELPNMGFRDGGTQEIFINGATFGFEAIY